MGGIALVCAVAAERELGLAALRVADAQRLLYARVDIVSTDDGPAVIELELIEPALYLDTSPQSAEILARALLAAAS